MFGAKWSPRLGLDLAGGVSVVYTAEGHNVSQADLDETVNILNLRVNGLGVSGAQVQTSGKNQISVSIPGVTDAQQVLDQIGQTARMYFRPVLVLRLSPERPEGLEGEGAARPASRRFPPVRRPRQLTAANLAINTTTGQATNNVPPDPQYATYPSTSVEKPGYATSTVLLPGVPAPAGACGQSGLRCVLGPGQMTGRSIASAQATQNQTGAWVVDYTLAGAAGSALWDKVAAGELPPAARDRARRAGVLGADHPAHPGDLLVVRRQGRDLGEPDAGGRAEPGAGHELRRAAGRC